MNPEYIIEIDRLVKIYKVSAVPAVDGLSMHVRKGEIFGLLGPNGAGKTTTINILCGLLRKTSGQIIIDGYHTGKNARHIKSIIGVVPQDIALYPSLTAMENLNFFGAIYGIEKKQLKKRIDELLDIFGLEKNRNTKLSVFSGGMKRRLNLIAGILHHPKILFLDEPTVGIDVQSKTLILEYLRTLNSQGTTIIYTSHYLEEAENFCSHIVIIDNGKLIDRGAPDELIKNCSGCSSLEDVYLHHTGHKLRD